MSTQQQRLTHKICTRVTNDKYAELKSLIDSNPANDMSRVLRDILDGVPIRVITLDKSFETQIDELIMIKAEIRAIGVNINQITHMFNTYPEPQRKLYFAKIAFERYLQIDQKTDKLFAIVAKIEKKWLSE